MAGVVSRKKSWRIWWIVDKQRYFASLKNSEYSKKDAEKEAYRREIEGERLIKGNCSFAEYARDFVVRSGKTPITTEKFNKMIERYAGYTEKNKISSLYDALTESFINNYKNECKAEGIANATINRDICYLKQLVADAREQGLKIKCNLKIIKYEKENPKIPDMPTNTERQQILDWFRNNCPKFYIWIYFVMTRGWRMGEFIKMAVSDVNLENRTLTVRHTKTGVERLAKLTDEDCMVIHEHILFLKRTDQYKVDGLLIPPQKKEARDIGRNALLKWVRKACRELNISKHITNHSFRHWVVTAVLDQTANIENVKQLTGHEDTRTILEHYTHSTTEGITRGLKVTKLKVSPLSDRFVPKRVPKNG
ncbi:MAG: tyrosine-type recombinase/integrase [Candidatus Omnitrophica bacterium]|nr:tyrosine-type recombinase/integrase [Candidatus Omnitrophota bacterium]